MVQFWIKSVAEVVAERWNVVQENTQVEVLQLVDLSKKSATLHFFAGGATQVFRGEMAQR